MELLRSADFSAYVRDRIRRDHVPGLAIALVRDDMIESVAFGKAALEPSRDCTPDSLFDIASASKSLTAAAVAMLVSDDRYPLVRYDAAMSSLLPGDFVMPGTDHGHVTVDDVLGHRTGMPAHDSSYFGPQAAQPDDARTITRNLRNLALVAPNRTQYMYNNMMYTAASYMVEQVTACPFSAFLRDNIFRPLGMNSTRLHPTQARAEALSHLIVDGHCWDPEAKRYLVVPFADAPEAQGAGKVLTSVNDYAKWVKAVMNRQAPVTEDMYAELLRKRISQEAPGDPASASSYYAAGWQVRHCGTHKLIWHEGSDDGFRSTHFFVPEFSFGGVILTNSETSGDLIDSLTNQFVESVVELSSGSPARPWTNPTLDESDSESQAHTDDRSDAESSSSFEEELRQELCPGIGTDVLPQELPLSVYKGEYWNPGYRHFQVGEKGGVLFVDANDRSMAFCLTFEHICDQTKYIAYMKAGTERKGIPTKAEFILENGIAVRLGLQLEEFLKEYIWFDRVNK
ncbi:beta-lactamase family protein [Drechmeria coniospora]|uniref:Beta-lactamase family protein n=1 Tax=Drechmeria coniospora TaxID=98403 RepID=A0A151GCQ3_DRECN|nr:beta-lactamase family protein [Drechmeria coniospora]KYK54824.1 beta-lactamase family protein [Drechmeria coniospora]ODA75947.1 hypothetical protein RJ55_08588 [Drechmeria coniospora]